MGVNTGIFFHEGIGLMYRFDYLGGIHRSHTFISVGMIADFTVQ